MMTNDTVSVPNGGGLNGLGVATSALGVIGSIYDTYQSNKTAKYNTDKTIAANKAEAELAYKRQLEMWRLQNEYNAPSSQMARYQSAGLNPNLIYGQGNSGNASSPPAYNPPNIQYQYEAGRYGGAVNSMLPVMMEVGTWMQNMRLGEAKIRGQEERNLYTASQSMRTKQLIEYLRQANPQMVKGLENKNAMFPYQQEAQVYKNDSLFWLKEQAQQKAYTEYGSQIFKDPNRVKGLGGLAKLRMDRMTYENAVKRTMAEYSDYGVTNPQQLINLVVGGALSAFTKTPVRINTGKKAPVSKSGIKANPRNLTNRLRRTY